MKQYHHLVPCLETLEGRDLPSAASAAALPGVGRTGHDWYLASAASGDQAAQVRHFGLPGDTFLAGDWNGDGRDDLVVVRRNAEGGLTWLIDTHGDDVPDIQ